MSVQDPESRNDVSPNKPLHILISNVGKRLSFYIFGEVVSRDEKVPPISYSIGERTNDIQSHCAKGHGLGRGLSTLPGYGCSRHIFGIDHTF